MNIKTKLKDFKHSVKFIKHVYVSITYRIVRLIDGLHDRRICGKDLTHSYDTQVKGGNRYGATCYWTLEEMMGETKFKSNDNLVDIGCGQGRLFAFFIEKDFPGEMTGIEYDVETASVAKAWTKKYPEKNICIINGDAFEQQYDEYNIFYYFNSFQKEYFKRFVLLIENQLTHPIRFYAMTDQLCWKTLW